MRLGRSSVDSPPIELSRETLARPLSWLLNEPEDRVELILAGLADMRARRVEEEAARMLAAQESAARIVAQNELARTRRAGTDHEPFGTPAGGGSAA